MAVNLNFRSYVPLPGKPDPHVPPSNKSRDHRFKQAGQKGDTCWYYALQILRNEYRIGKNPLLHQLEKRKIEVLISNYRKELTSIHLKLKIYLAAASFAEEELKKRCTKQDGRLLLEKINTILVKNSADKFSIILKDFINQKEFDDFKSFAENKYYTALNQINDSFLSKINITVIEVLNIFAKKINKKITEMSLFERLTSLSNVAIMQCYAMSGAKFSDWHPNQPISRLQEEIDRHGPHVVKGRFGTEFYKENPSVSNTKLEGRAVYYWPKGSTKINQNSSDPHMIVIIKTEDNCIYYLDPQDESTPEITSQKIYKISYENLKNSLYSLIGVDVASGFLPDQGKGNLYAYHM